MPPELTAPQISPGGRIGAIISALPRSWRGTLPVLAAMWSAIAIVTARDWVAMFDQWWNISTYNHILFIPAIVGWLVWSRWSELAKLSPQNWWPGLALVAIAAFIWLIGSVAGVNLISQAGAVLMLQSAVVAALGPRTAFALSFPLFYMVFLVPFGDELIPALQMLTAKMVIGLTQWSGIAAQIDGVFIDTPVGLFEVAEACSGVKFLIAMIALGALVAHSCFTSLKRRAIFLGLAIVLPIAANGVRAWGTIYLAQFLGIEFAAGFDHVFYGWIFFALVVAALLAGSWRWFDRSPDDPAIDAERLNAMRIFDVGSKRAMGSGGVLAIAALLLGMFSAWNIAAETASANVGQTVALPQISGWQRVTPVMTVAWQPRAAGADQILQGQYRNANGDRIDVVVAVYLRQGRGVEVGAPGQGALPFDTAWRWLQSGPSDASQTGDVLLADGRVRRVAVTSYRQGDLLTGSRGALKLAGLRDRLALSPDATTMLILSAEEGALGDGARTIAAFQRTIGDRAQWLDRIAGVE